MSGSQRVSPARGLLALAFVFGLLVALRVNGFSLPIWHEVIDGSPATEVLIGEPQSIRSDDWKAHLPLALSQAAQQPSFPVENPLIGLGQNALVPIDLPVASPFVLFRPTLWGFFLGDDAGLAWLWWSRVLGLALVWYGVFFVVTGGRRLLSAGGAAVLVAAPFFQFWSFNTAQMVAAMGASFLATVALARAATPRAIRLSGAALAAAGAWFALTLYPPYQVSLAWLYVALCVGFGLDQRQSLPLRQHGVLRALALSGAAVFVLAVVAAFAWEAHAAIAAMRDTVYPGRRISVGGDRPLWQLLTANFAAGGWAEKWGPFSNLCEAASFWFLAPAPLLLWLWRASREQARVDPLLVSLLIYQCALVGFAAFGYPAWLARVTGLSFVPGRRAILGIGLADALLLLRVLAVAPPAIGRERGVAVAIVALWIGLLAVASLPLLRALPGAPALLLPAVLAANGIVAWVALASRRRALAPWLLAAACFATTAWFNPVVIGGSAFLKENPLSRQILEIDRAAEGRTTWIAFGGFLLSDLFRVLGVHSIGGLMPLPQLALWERVDPLHKGHAIYDRYAHVIFVATPTPQPFFHLLSQDVVIVDVDPASPAVRTLGATHALFHGTDAERSAFEKMAGYEWIGSYGENHLYRVPPLAP